MNSFANDGKDSLQEEDGLVGIHLVVAVAAGTIEHFCISIRNNFMARVKFFISSWFSFSTLASFPISISNSSLLNHL